LTKKLSLAEYNSLSPQGKGYAAYMQAAWNKVIPKKCPFPKDSTESQEWDQGQWQAYIDIVDCDDD
jgi:hypothetical protein